MDTDTKIDNELKAIAPILAAIPKENSFQVPNDYFENLDYNLSQSVLATKLSNIPKELPFDVPMNYFDVLPGLIEQSIAATRLENIPKEIPFTVPANYFEKLNSEIQDKVIASKKQKGFDWAGLIFRPKYSLTLVAAAVAFVIIFKPFQTKDKFMFTAQDVTGSVVLNDIDEGTIIETLYSDNKSNAIPKQGEIENYLLDNSVDESQAAGQL
ncbi:MAG: hypothetical protein WCL14_04665 [Bacteroidota bacterium]